MPTPDTISRIEYVEYYLSTLKDLRGRFTDGHRKEAARMQGSLKTAVAQLKHDEPCPPDDRLYVGGKTADGVDAWMGMRVHSPEFPGVQLRIVSKRKVVVVSDEIKDQKFGETAQFYSTPEAAKAAGRKG